MLLQLSGLAAGYGAKTVISDVSFELEPGQILAFLGHNGAGKTTTLKTVMGLLSPRAGEVTFDGQRIERMDVSRRVAMGLRLLPEGRGIFPDLSVSENIDVVAARNATGKPMFGIPDVYRLFPVLDERRTTRAGSLSGGQQQMLALGGGDPWHSSLPSARRTIDRPRPQSRGAPVPTGPRRLQIPRDDRGSWSSRTSPRP